MNYLVKNCPAYKTGCNIKDKQYPYKICSDKKDCVLIKIISICKQKINFNENLVKKENVQNEKIILELLGVKDVFY